MGNTMLLQAEPLKVIKAEDNATRFADIQKLLDEWKPGRWWSACRCTRTAPNTR
jgi:putative Holliday junction resolvase